MFINTIMMAIGLYIGIITTILIQKTAPKKEITENSGVDVEVTKLILQKDSYENVNNMLDTIIKDAIDMYMILQHVTDDTYLTNKIINEMSAYVYGMTYNKMTPGVLSTLGLFYDVSTDAKLADVLKLRIKLHVVNTVQEQNAPIQS